MSLNYPYQHEKKLLNYPSFRITYFLENPNIFLIKHKKVCPRIREQTFSKVVRPGFEPEFPP